MPREARHWEGGAPARPYSADTDHPSVRAHGGDVQFGPSVALEEPAGLERMRVATLREKATK